MKSGTYLEAICTLNVSIFSLKVSSRREILTKYSFLKNIYLCASGFCLNMHNVIQMNVFFFCYSVRNPHTHRNRTHKLCFTLINSQNSIGCFINLASNFAAGWVEIRSGQRVLEWIYVKLEPFHTKPLNPGRIPAGESTQSTRDLCNDCNSEFCIVEKFQKYEKDRVLASLSCFQCELCGKSSTVLSSLRSHQRTDVDNESYCCEFRNEKFSVEYMEKQYLTEQHRAEKALKKCFECNICTKRFWRKSNLSAHHRLHNTPEPDFHCNLCGKHFRLKSNLNAHLSLHKVLKFVCDLCQNFFNSAHRLREHRESHANAQCQYCEKTFSSQYEVNTHIRIKHQKWLRGNANFVRNIFARQENFGPTFMKCTMHKSHLHVKNAIELFASRTIWAHIMPSSVGIR